MFGPYSLPVLARERGGTGYPTQLAGWISLALVFDPRVQSRATARTSYWHVACTFV